MVDSREGSATTATIANRDVCAGDRGPPGHGGGGDGADGDSGHTRDVAGKLLLVLDEHLCPIQESLDAAGQNLSGLRQKFAAMEATLNGLFSEAADRLTTSDDGGRDGHAGCAAKLGDARRAVEDLSASREAAAGRRLRDDNAVLRRDLQLQRGRQGVARPAI